MTPAVVNLYQANRGGSFQVESVPKIGLLENLGLRVGTNIKVQDRYALGGPVLLKVENAFAVAIGKDIATQIAVRSVAKV